MRRRSGPVPATTKLTSVAAEVRASLTLQAERTPAATASDTSFHGRLRAHLLTRTAAEDVGDFEAGDLGWVPHLTLPALRTLRNSTRPALG